MKKILLHSLTTILYVILMVKLSKPVNIIGLVDMVFLTLLFFAINYLIYISNKTENSTN